jgi:adenylate cyclase
MSAGRRPARRRVYLISLGVIGLVGALYLAAPEFLRTIEAKLYDLHFTVRGVRDPGDRVVIVAIDERSLGVVGRWPWPRSTLAELVRRLSSLRAKVIVFDVLLSEPEVSGELRATRHLAERFRALRPQFAGAGARAFEQDLARLLGETDHDAQLETAIRTTGQVVLPMVFDLAPGVPSRPPEPEGRPFKSALTNFRHYDERGVYPPPSALSAALPIARFADAAVAVAHVTMLADLDGTTRWEQPVWEHRGHYYPSVAVEAVRLALNLERAALRLDFGRALEIGATRVPVDPRNRFLIDYPGPARTFRHVSAADLLAGTVPAEAIRDRLVFVGATAEGTYDLRVTPVSPVFPGVEKHAAVAANLLDGHFLSRPDWVALIEVGGVILWPLLLGWLLPRLRPAVGLPLALLMWVALFAAVHLAFHQGVWIPVVYSSLALTVGAVAITGYLHLTEERQRLSIKRAFERFVNPEVVERIAEDPAALRFGGEVRTLTVLFSDVRDFTTYTERHPPQEVVHVLREYFTRMVDQVLAHDGTLDKFIGDGLMAFFGAPLALPDHAERACRTALAMVAEVQQLQTKWLAEGREPFRIGIGINTGEMVVGNLGSEQLFAYTVVGDPVNLAARLESLNKEHHTQVPIIISETTYRAAGDILDVVRLGEVTVKGKTKPVMVYELRGLRAPTATGQERGASLQAARSGPEVS